jgi:catechol 2,3-dioxygenase-like lactoylglutathione lyase family enzyme
MIDHVSVGVSNLERAARFYEAALAALGLSRLVTRPATVGFGKGYPEFWINLRTEMAAVEPANGFAPGRPARSMPFMRRRCKPEAAPTARRACARTTACATTRPL